MLEIEDLGGQRAALNDLGLLYIDHGKYNQALGVLQQSLAIARKLEDRQGEAQTLGNLVLVYESLGDYDRARDAHEQQLAIEGNSGEGCAKEGIICSLNPLLISYQMTQIAVSFSFLISSCFLFLFQLYKIQKVAT